MTEELTVFKLVSEASFVVKFVLLVLLIASVVSWTMIFLKFISIRRARDAANAFEDQFWSGKDLVTIYNRVNDPKHHTLGMELIFISGFKEFARLRNHTGLDAQAIIEGTQRAMRVSMSREVDELEIHLSFLATVGSTSPYVGLFGTVWGIMNSFTALGNVHQATLAMVAPGIAEALVATAMGLFAAIPAVIAYNRYVNDVERLTSRYDTFVEEFSTILQRQTHTK